jgi:putative peptidoglycan lipid II flippase
MARALFGRGKLSSPQDMAYLWAILAGSAVGLLASTSGRLYSSTYYALHDTKTPLKFAVIRVALTSTLGYLFAVPLPKAMGIDPHWGAAGLTVSFGIAGWVEYMSLRHALGKRIGETGLPASLSVRLWVAAIVAGAAAYGLKRLLSIPSSIVTAVLVLGTFGLVYLVATVLLKVPEASILLRRLKIAR